MRSCADVCAQARSLEGCAEYAELPAVGHLPMEEDARAFLDAVVPFVRRVAAAAQRATEVEGAGTAAQQGAGLRGGEDAPAHEAARDALTHA